MSPFENTGTRENPSSVESSINSSMDADTGMVIMSGRGVMTSRTIVSLNSENRVNQLPLLLVGIFGIAFIFFVVPTLRFRQEIVCPTAHLHRSGEQPGRPNKPSCVVADGLSGGVRDQPTKKAPMAIPIAPITEAPND